MTWDKNYHRRKEEKERSSLWFTIKVVKGKEEMPLVEDKAQAAFEIIKIKLGNRCHSFLLLLFYFYPPFFCKVKPLTLFQLDTHFSSSFVDTAFYYIILTLLLHRSLLIYSSA